MQKAAAHKAYLLIGGNMGDRKAALAAARSGLEKTGGVIRRLSSLYETAAWGMEEQDAFLNQALLLETTTNAGVLLAELLRLEESLGRKREVRYGPRIIDIDILFFDAAVIHEEGLTVPHPQVQNRRFALTPLAEIAPNLIHPVLQKTVAQLLRECPDALPVQKIS